jgi:signal transduction histidine kinase
MIAAAKPANESERLSALYEYDLLDTMPEKEYDDITRIAADICGTSISLISLIDNNRQWFKSKFGFEPMESHRDIAFCAHAILDPTKIFVIDNPATDERFHDNPLVAGNPNISFYAGVPLVNDEGNALGTLCVIDNKPNKISKAQEETLKALARQIVAYFDIRKKNQQLARQKKEMEQLNADLTRFAYVAAHDIKSPCNSLTMSVMFFKDMYADALSKDALTLLDMMEATSRNASEMVEGILRHTLNVNKSDVVKEKFTFGSLIEEIRPALTIPSDFSFSIRNRDFGLYSAPSILKQIFLNLCTNAIKYNDKEYGEVTVSVADHGPNYLFTVKDNGPGISLADQARVFDLFTTLGVPDRYNKKGTGIGLATVQRLVQRMDGNIKIESEPGLGCCFYISIEK